MTAGCLKRNPYASCDVLTDNGQPFEAAVWAPAVTPTGESPMEQQSHNDGEAKLCME
jgi:hypothetical protein